MKKVIILGNSAINNGNRGCVALSYCAIYLINSILGKDNYELYLTESLQKNGKHSIKIIDDDISYYSISNIYPISFKSLIKMILNIRNTIKSYRIFKTAYCVLDIGQGDSFADIYGENRFKWINSIHQVARFFSKPYILLPQTIGPFQQEKIKSLANTSIRNATFVMTRDKQSFEYVIQNIPEQKNLSEYIDVAFFLPYTKKSFANNKVHVGLNISALLWNGGYTRDNQFNLKCDYRKCVRGIIAFFLSLGNTVIHLIPHVVEQERGVENDYAVSFDLYEEYNNEQLVLAPFFLSPIDAKNYISALDFFMGARMHTTIAAFSAEVPVVPMAYSRKFNGLFIDTLDYRYMVDLKKDSDEDVLNKIRTAFDDRVQIKEIVKLRIDGVVEEKKKQLQQDLAKCLNL